MLSLQEIFKVKNSVTNNEDQDDEFSNYLL